LDQLKISPGLDYLIANVDEMETRNLTHANVSDESELPAGTAVAASAGGGVWPADTFASKRRETSTVPMHSELEEMVSMVDTDVIVLGEGSDVYTKNMHHVGELEQLRFDTRTGQLLGLEIKGGFLHHSAFELPGEFIAGLDEGSIYLNVDKEEVKPHILEAS
jgi:sporulation protein YlmC with PRC-barrel domain